MIYRHRYEVHASVERVSEFHSRSNNMAAITPPPVIISQHNTPAVLAEGDEMDFTMWLGLLPVRWLASIEAVSPNGFTDRQLRGPFAEWIHQHTFTAMGEQTTVVEDEVTLRLCQHPLWWLVGMGMRLGLPALFAYRAWKTRRILE